MFQNGILLAHSQENRIIYDEDNSAEQASPKKHHSKIALSQNKI